ncbi:MAG: AAA family ATPase [Ferruginibacter sp.]|nr:AAA family ATPase [Cytophagales bacterium]
MKDKKFKFKDLRVYGSAEWLADGKKVYRQVFDRSETTYVHCELSFYNKLFDEEDWNAYLRVRCVKLHADGTQTEVCVLDENKTVSKDENVFTSFGGWGAKKPGSFWKKGTYQWEAYIDTELVGTQAFHIEEVGLVTKEGNPYFNIKSIRLFESPGQPLPVEQRKYYTQFQADKTKYIWLELTLENLVPKPWHCETTVNFFNSTKHFVGTHTQVQPVDVTTAKEDVVITLGWGSDRAGTWHKNHYTAELIFMNQLLATVLFEVGTEFTEGENRIGTSPATALPFVTQPGSPLEEENLEEVMADLNGMIGLENVKEQLADYTNYLKFIRLRMAQGFEENQRINLHTVFTGNPGTGKTTVAKYLGKIYQKMGLLSKGKVTEVGRAELVGEFIGQTAPKAKDVIERARGGVLLIDEAYSLARSQQDSKDFGKEVIEVLIKEMSDGPGDIAIVVVGYPKEMQTFLNSNPGLKSRFNQYFDFPDYLPQELMQIADSAARKKRVQFSPEASILLYRRLTEAFRNRDRTFGNARTVYALVEEAKMNLGLRVMKSLDPNTHTPEQLQLIDPADVDKIYAKKVLRKPDIKTDPLLLEEAMAELDALVGLDQVKTEALELIRLVKYYNETGRDVLNKFSLHTVFTGNPGTGKTTVARILAKVFKALGILERGHLVECDRQGLVAGYVGQTAIKTREVIDEAEGGVLFIDEAYALASGGGNDFGNEAIETLLKQMEDRRGQFIVIVAGYTDRMNEFLKANPGLQSRFDRTLNFEDYSTVQLCQIGLMMLAEENLVPDARAAAHLSRYLTGLYELRDKYFGNARSVRQVIREAVKKQHLRMALLSSDERTPEAMQTLAYEDVADFQLSNLGKGNGIGFRLTAK